MAKRSEVADQPPHVGTEHLPLFARPVAAGRATALPVRSHDPPAAQDAALAGASRAKSQRARLLELTDQAGPRGLVHTEADDLLGWAGGTANRRYVELHDAGRVARLTERRETKHGAKAHLYVTPRHVAGRALVDLSPHPGARAR